MSYGHQGRSRFLDLAMEELLIATKTGIKDIPYRGEPLGERTCWRPDRSSRRWRLAPSPAEQDLDPSASFGELDFVVSGCPTVKEQGSRREPGELWRAVRAAGTSVAVVNRLAPPARQPRRRHARERRQRRGAADGLLRRCRDAVPAAGSAHIDAKARVFTHSK